MDASIVTVLPVDGTYQIHASAFGQIGRYEITVGEATIEDAEATPIGLGETLEVNLSSGETDVFAFQGAAGTVVRVTMVSQEFELDAFLTLTDPHGMRLVDEGFFGEFSIEAILGVEGTYLLEVDAYPLTFMEVPLEEDEYGVLRVWRAAVPFEVADVS